MSHLSVILTVVVNTPGMLFLTDLLLTFMTKLLPKNWQGQQDIPLFSYNRIDTVLAKYSFWFQFGSWFKYLLLVQTEPSNHAFIYST